MLGGGHSLQAHKASPRKCEKGKNGLSNQTLRRKRKKKGSQKSDVEKNLLLTPEVSQETPRDGLLKTKFPASQCL